MSGIEIYLPKGRSRQRRWKFFTKLFVLVSDEKQKEIPRSSDELSRKILSFLSGHFSPQAP